MTARTDLLELVAKKLDTNPPFNFAKWVGEDWGGKPDLSCGTSACALGHATTIPELAALGLKLYKSHANAVACVCDHVPTEDEMWNVNRTSIHTAMRIFNLTDDEARYLFMPGRGLGAQPSAKEVAAHIRKFIADGAIE